MFSEMFFKVFDNERSRRKKAIASQLLLKLDKEKEIVHFETLSQKPKTSDICCSSPRKQTNIRKSQFYKKTIVSSFHCSYETQQKTQV